MTAPAARPPARRRGAPLIAGLAYVSLVLAAAWPLTSHLNAWLPGEPSSDTGVYVWNLWVFRQELLVHHASPLWTSYILAPGPPIDLALHNYTLFQDALGLLLAPLAGLVGAFNLTWLLMQALSGFGVFLLARRYTARDTVAWLAGALFACSPTIIARSAAHQSLVAAAPLAFFLLFVLRAAERRSLGDAALAGVCAAWAAVCDAYYGIYCVLLLIVTVAALGLRWEPRGVAQPPGRLRAIVGALMGLPTAAAAIILLSGGGRLELFGLVIRARTIYTPMLVLTLLALTWGWLWMRGRGRWRVAARVDRVRIGQVVTGGLVCTLLLLPLLSAAWGRVRAGGSLQEPVFWRSSPPGADLLAFFVPNPNHPLAPGALPAFLAQRPDMFPENVASVPWVAMAVIAAALLQRRRPPGLFVALAVCFALLALGPFVTVAHVNTQVPGPWAVLRYVPILGAARAPTRFVIPMLIAVAVLFAWALDTIGRRRLVVSAVSLALAFELWPVPRVTASAGVPRVYQTIASDPDDVTVLELPFGIWDGTSQVGFANIATQYYQTTHGKRLLGGYLSRVPLRRVRGQLAFPTLRLLAAMSERAAIEPNLAEAARDDAGDFLQQARVRYVVIDPRLASPELRTTAIELLRLEPVSRADGLELYRTEWGQASKTGSDEHGKFRAYARVAPAR